MVVAVVEDFGVVVFVVEQQSRAVPGMGAAEPGTAVGPGTVVGGMVVVGTVADGTAVAGTVQ